MSDELSYKQKMERVQRAIAELQKSEDIDEAIETYERANELLKQCEAKIESARGKFAELTRDIDGNPH